jgi:hypothetical protein
VVYCINDLSRLSLIFTTFLGIGCLQVNKLGFCGHLFYIHDTNDFNLSWHILKCSVHQALEFLLAK